MIGKSAKKGIERAEKRVKVAVEAHKKDDNKKSRKLKKRAQRKLARYKRFAADVDRRNTKETEAAS